MRKLLLLAVSLFLLPGADALAQRPEVVLGPGLGAGRTAYTQDFNRTLYKDTVYILTGIYIVDSTYTLTIQPGTLIKGDTVATFLISRGGKIMADGTKDEPIVMTSMKPAGQRAPGDWGGVIILGSAPTNRTTEPVVEGGAGALGGVVGAQAAYGGTNPDDNSGVFRYVRIEYPGYRFQPNNEINGLTMGGVGRGTTLEYVQVSYSLDDGFEWFGGTVNGRYLIAYASQDDDFDTDFGFRGNLQFLLSVKDPNVWDSDASNGFESDNDGSGTTAVPFTSATWSNVTLIGPLRYDGATLPAGNNHQDGMKLRRNTQLKIYNSVVMGFPYGINVPDAATVTNATNGDLVVKSTSIQSATTPLRGSDATAVTTWFTAAGSNNNGSATRSPSAIGFVDVGDLHNPDARPTASSELATAGTDFTALTDGFWTSVSYRGAFDPSKSRSEQWDFAWTNYNPLYSKYNVAEVVLGPGLGAGRTAYTQDFNRTLYKDTVYILTGIYIVDSTYTLTIQPGTLIKGDTVATFLISRGGKIMADGTKDEPIVMTSMKPAGQRAPGDWGGVIILGSAPTNRTTEPVVEGGAGALGGVVGAQAAYGGTNPDDNSGVFRYVRIEYPGYRFQPNNEINGLTMGGVGRGTTLEYVQVSYSLDDGFEWFGGTVNGRYLIAYASQDDDFDTDFGFRGNLQFLLSVKDPNVWDSDASNGFESDNDGSGTTAVPFTSATWSNVTLIGPLRYDGATLPAGNNHQDGMKLRRNTQLKIYNSVVMGFPYGINVPDAATVTNATNGDLVVKSTSIQSATTPLRGSDATAVTTWFTAAGSNNNGSATRSPSAIGFVDVGDLHNPDARPTASSELATAGTDFTALTDGFWTSVSYRGAFDPSKSRSEQWDFAWTNYNPNNLVSSGIPTSVEEIAGEVVPQEYSLDQNFPNPFNPSTVIRFSVPNDEFVTLKVYDMLGREVSTLTNGFLSAGKYTATFNASSLASGAYFYILQAGQVREVKRMMLLK